MNKTKEEQLMQELRSNVYELVSCIFDTIDSKIKARSYKMQSKTVANSNTLRMSIKNLRRDVLQEIANMGKNH